MEVALIEVNVRVAEGRKDEAGGGGESGWSREGIGSMGDDLGYAVGGG